MNKWFRTPEMSFTQPNLPAIIAEVETIRQNTDET